MKPGNHFKVTKVGVPLSFVTKTTLKPLRTLQLKTFLGEKPLYKRGGDEQIRNLESGDVESHPNLLT